MTGSAPKPVTTYPLRAAIHPNRASVYNPLLNLWRRRDLTMRLISHNFQSRFRGSQLGILWSLISPLILLAAYTFVFSTVLRARWNESGVEVDSTVQFALILFAGLIPYTAIAEVLNNSPRVIVSVPNYVKRVVFPLEILPVVSVGSAIIQSLISAIVLIIVSSILTGTIQPTTPLVFVAYIPLILLSLSLSWFLASLGVFFRDISQSVLIISQLLLFVSPIFYSEDMVPQPFATVLQLNPLTGVVTNFRRSLLWNQPIDWNGWIVSFILTACLAYGGYLWFVKTKSAFADVL